MPPCILQIFCSVYAAQDHGSALCVRACMCVCVCVLVYMCLCVWAASLTHAGAYHPLCPFQWVVVLPPDPGCRGCCRASDGCPSGPCGVSFIRAHTCLPPACSVQGYFSDAWNTFDSLIVIGSIIDVALSEADVSMRPSAAAHLSPSVCVHPAPRPHWLHLDKSQTPASLHLTAGLSY